MRFLIAVLALFFVVLSPSSAFDFEKVAPLEQAEFSLKSLTATRASMYQELKQQGIYANTKEIRKAVLDLNNSDPKITEIRNLDQKIQKLRFDLEGAKLPPVESSNFYKKNWSELSSRIEHLKSLKAYAASDISVKDAAKNDLSLLSREAYMKQQSLKLRHELVATGKFSTDSEITKALGGSLQEPRLKALRNLEKDLSILQSGISRSTRSRVGTITRKYNTSLSTSNTQASVSAPKPAAPSVSSVASAQPAAPSASSQGAAATPASASSAWQAVKGFAGPAALKNGAVIVGGQIKTGATQAAGVAQTAGSAVAGYTKTKGLEFAAWSAGKISSGASALKNGAGIVGGQIKTGISNLTSTLKSGGTAALNTASNATNSAQVRIDTGLSNAGIQLNRSFSGASSSSIIVEAPPVNPNPVTPPAASTTPVTPAPQPAPVHTQPGHTTPVLPAQPVSQPSAGSAALDHVPPSSGSPASANSLNSVMQTEVIQNTVKPVKDLAGNVQEAWGGSFKGKGIHEIYESVKNGSSQVIEKFLPSRSDPATGRDGYQVRRDSVADALRNKIGQLDADIANLKATGGSAKKIAKLENLKGDLESRFEKTQIGADGVQIQSEIAKLSTQIETAKANGADRATIETLQKNKANLEEKLEQVKADSAGTAKSFVKDGLKFVAISAATQGILNIVDQARSGEGIDIAKAFDFVTTPQFMLGTAGAFAGGLLVQKGLTTGFGQIAMATIGNMVPGILKPVVAVLPYTFGAMLGSELMTGTLGDRSLTEMVLSGVGSTIGMLAGSALGPVGSIVGSVIGGMIGDKVAALLSGEEEEKIEVTRLYNPNWIEFDHLAWTGEDQQLSGSFENFDPSIGGGNILSSLNTPEDLMTARDDAYESYTRLVDTAGPQDPKTIESLQLFQAITAKLESLREEAPVTDNNSF